MELLQRASENLAERGGRGWSWQNTAADHEGVDGRGATHSQAGAIDTSRPAEGDVGLLLPVLAAADLLHPQRLGALIASWLRQVIRAVSASSRALPAMDTRAR